MEYRSEAVSVEGFVQQLMVYVSSGYLFYVTGTIPERKDPQAVSEKLIERYGINISKWARARRKQGGHANLQFLRFGRFFVLIATHGHHEFFLEEPARDIRRQPLVFHGYSISKRRGVDRKYHASCRIAPDEYGKLKAHFVECLALHRSSEKLARAFYRVPFEPWAPVRRQLLNILRAVNRKRKVAGFELVPYSVLRLRRRIVKPFGEDAWASAA